MSLFQLIGIGLKTALSVSAAAQNASLAQAPKAKRKSKTCTPCEAARRVEAAKNFGQK